MEVRLKKWPIALGIAIFGVLLLPKLIHLAYADDQHSFINTQKHYPYQLIITDQQGNSQKIFGSSQSLLPVQIGTDLGQIIYPEDKLTSFPDPSFLMGSVISVTRAPLITINDWGKDQIYRSFAGTVQSLFDEKGIDLGKDDRIDLAPDTKIVDGMRIKITRVAVTTVDENKPIDFKIVTKKDPNMDEGKSRVDQVGVKGVLKQTYRVTRENGVQKSKVLIVSVTVTPSIDQIVYQGTRPAISVACRFNSTVIAAAIKYSYSANKICNLMMLESHGNPESVASNGHYGLFQYTIGDDGSGGSWGDMSSRAGYGGAQWSDPTAQIMTTAWALTNGYGSKWGL